MFNPYPMLGAPSIPCWPRGLPLQNTKEEVVSTGRYVDKNDSQKVQFAVLQSLADVQPDVDAIYRLTKNTPFQFKRPEPFDAPSVQTGNFFFFNIITISSGNHYNVLYYFFSAFFLLHFSFE